MAKYTEQEKLEAVLRRVDENMSYRHSAHILGCDPKLVEQWVKMYQLHGTEGLSESHKRFSGEFKIYVVEYMHRNQLSQMDASVLFGIPNRASVGNWARIYDEKGPEGLCRGYPGRMKEKMNSRKNTGLDKKRRRNTLPKYNALECILKKIAGLSSGKNRPGSHFSDIP